jgi:hypothetical protein
VTRAGSKISVRDTYSVGWSNFSVARQVTVDAVADGEPVVAFSSRFSMQYAGTASTSSTSATSQFFMPSVWYHNSQDQLPPGALAGDPSAASILVREDRLPFPLVMHRDAVGTSVQVWGRLVMCAGLRCMVA